MRKALENADFRKGSHPGLILSRYLKNGDSSGDRKTLFGNGQSPLAQNQEFYKIFFDRHKEALKRMEEDETGSVCFRKFTATPLSRMIIGLGIDNVLDTGITLHHTYGVPYIPGSALKGLCAHYCNAVLGATDEKFKMGKWDEKKQRQIGRNGDYYEVLFGNISGQDDSSDGGGQGASAGFITFHDALIEEKEMGESLCMDVMTPHHAGYYSGKSEKPTDFDDPVPVPYLSVKGSFFCVLSCEDASEEGQKWLDLAKKILVGALENWGIGGKTSSGYGRMKIKEELPKPKAPPRPKLEVGQKVKVEYEKKSARKNNVTFIIHEKTVPKEYKGKMKKVGDLAKEEMEGITELYVVKIDYYQREIELSGKEPIPSEGAPAP